MMAETSARPPDYTLTEIWQFPVKGFPGKCSTTATANANQLLENDRRYAISNGHPVSHDKLDQGWLSKRHFVQLLAEPRLAGLTLDVDEDAQIVRLSNASGLLMQAPLDDAGPVMQHLHQLLPERFQIPPKLCHLHDGGYTDTDAAWITIGGSASLDDFAQITHTRAGNRRFRLNLIIQTTSAFEEFQWIGKHINIGETQLEIIEPVGRCAAINVDPETSTRTQDYLRTMRQIYGHTDLGVFARFVRGGELCVGAPVKILD